MNHVDQLRGVRFPTHQLNSNAAGKGSSPCVKRHVGRSRLKCFLGLDGVTACQLDQQVVLSAYHDVCM